MLTEEEKALIEKYYQEWLVELDKSLEEIRCKEVERKNMPTKIQLLRKCEDVIKAFLKDPNSYKVLIVDICKKRQELLNIQQLIVLVAE